MSSQIITPPDHIPSKDNILIINAHTEQLTTLVLWLKTIREQYNIHVWHNNMEDSLSWVLNVAQKAKTILAYKQEQHNIPSDVLELFKDHIIWFGPDTEYTDLIHFFLVESDLKV